MALRGDTSNLLLADIFQTLSQNGQLGLLTLRGEGQQHRVLFSQTGITAYDAKVFHATRLGHLLVVGGVVDRRRIDAAIDQVATAGPDSFSLIPLLVLLEEQDVLTIEQGAQILRNEVREELFEIFTLSRMEFEFDDSEVPVEGIPQQCFFRTEEVVMEAARRLDEWQLIDRQLGKVQEFYVTDGDIDSESVDPRVLELLDGSNTVTDIAERLLLSRFEVTRFVWRLLEEGKLRPASADELIQSARQLDQNACCGRVTRILQRARSHLDPSDPRLDDIGDLLIRSGADSAAITVLLVRARSLLAEGNQETAYAQVLRARDIDATNQGVLQTLAEIHQARGEKDSEAKVLTSLAERSAANEKFDDAVEVAIQVARLNPDSPLLDRAFPVYCQQADMEKRGADVLSEAAGRRTSSARAAVLYDAILLLDPSRGDIRKAKARQRRSRNRHRIFWMAGGLLLIPLLFFGRSYVFGRMAEERLAGRLEGARLMVGNGDATLAEAELRAILAEAPGGSLGVEAESLLAEARARLAASREQEQTERDQSMRGELVQVQTDIERKLYAAATVRLTRVEQQAGSDRLTNNLLGVRRDALERTLEVEHASLLRLAGRFTVPESDSALLTTHGEYAAPFSTERREALLAFQRELAACRVDSSLFADVDRLATLTRESLQAIETVRPGLEATEARIARNQQLELLSEDYLEIREAEANGEFGAAVRGYERLLRNYGDGSLKSMFEKRRRAVLEVETALDEIRRLVEDEDVVAANQRARRAAVEARDLGIGKIVGYPLLISTLPTGAALEAGGKSLGTSPTLFWVKEGSPAKITASAPGFVSADRDVSIDSEPNIFIELTRTGQFEVDLGTPVDVCPVVSGGSLYVGARDGVLYRIDLQNGRRLGRVPTGSLAGIAAPPLCHGDLILLTLGEGEIRAVHRDTLETRWSRPLDSALAGPPALVGSRLLAATIDGSLYEIDAASGQERLIAAVEGPLRCGPAVIGPVVAVGKTNGSVVGISSGAGEILFSTPERTHPIIGIAASGDLFVAADDSGTLLALAFRDGQDVWQRPASQSAAAPPTAYDSLLVYAAGHRAAVLDARDGAVRLEAEVDDWIAGTPSLAGGRLYVGDRSGTLSVFEVSSGTLLFKHPMKGQLRAEPLVVREGVIVVSDRGVVTLLGA